MSLTKLRKTPQLAQELWDMIASKLPAISARNAAHTLHFPLSSSQSQHCKAWGAIFKNESWINKITSECKVNPILISPARTKDYSRYMTLVINDNSGDSRYHPQLFLDSLQPYQIINKDEIKFETGFTLNVQDVFYAPSMISIKPNKLFSCRRNRLCLSYLFWQDEKHRLRKFTFKGIRGIIGHSNDGLKNELIVCELTFISPTRNQIQCIFWDSDRRAELGNGILSRLDQLVMKKGVLVVKKKSVGARSTAGWFKS